VVFGASNDAVEAALAGGAVALADFAMVATELSEGRLIRPFELSVNAPSEFAYFLVYPKEAATEPRTAAFREWMLAQVAEPAE
jgi:LysR family glycine cleavage system transcriptional activator